MRYFLIIFMLVSSTAYASVDVDKMADAIFWAEGGYDTNFPYGIKSVTCRGYDDCRRICINSIRNGYKRYQSRRANDQRTFLEHFRDRYCPLSDSPLNSSWLRNVKWFLDNPKEIK